jgi:hypothetical protein
MARTLLGARTERALCQSLAQPAGCEPCVGPNLITGRRDQIGCVLFTPIDRAEARRRTTRVGHPAQARR